MEKLLLNEDMVISQYEITKNIYKVAEHFGVSISPIRRILKKNGIVLSQTKYSVDDKFFDTINDEYRAYWLGFLFADGYIRERKSGNSLEMKLSIKDKEHLMLFRDCLKSTHVIKDSYNRVKYKNGYSQSHMSHLAIYSLKLVESIKKCGIHSRKTFTIEFPDIPKNLTNHFIRGYFDGDGSFSFNPEKYKIHTNIVCASDKFRDRLIEILTGHGIDARNYGNIVIDIQSKLGNLKFYNYIYKNATIFLKRKKEKYEKFREYYEYNN